MTSENEKDWGGITRHNDKKLSWLTDILNRTTNDEEKDVIASLKKSHTHFSENFMMFPISAKRMIVLINPFYKFRYAGMKSADEIVANDILKQSFGTDDTYDPMAAAEEPASDSDDLDDDTSENGFVINVHAIKHHITPDEIETTDTDEDMETPANVDAFLNDDDDDEDDNDSHTHHSRFKGFFKK